MKTVRVNVREGYDVNIGSGILPEFGAMLAEVAKPPKKVCIVSDSNVAPLYGETVRKSLESAGFSPFTIVFPAGEQSKNMTTLASILEEMADASLTRSDLVVALGGGVTGDMAGFAASIYLRGVKFAQIPTTLLAAVDSSVGGKTAVDLNHGKNLAGVFAQPILVCCDTDTFMTLTPEIFADGAAESIKYGILDDKPLFEAFSGGTVQNIEDIVASCVQHKADYVERDEFDRGDRKFLNLGHTMAHAIEKLSGYAFPHGHAVAVGTVMIARAGEKMGVTEKGTTDEIIRIFKENNLPVASPYDAESLFTAACGDKKREGGKITVIMIEKIGKCFLKTVPVEELRNIAVSGKE
ncbi:MAG: 3-dehydroquinate synthase [Oscillospiraceae bacterium]|nr:3-dehydroquinate synthase [Oscillospiraceae bacterium]